MGSPWIDRYPLLEPEPFLALLGRHESVRVVTWGHVHQDFEDLRGHTRLYSAPSSAINGVAGQSEFVPDKRGPGVRWFELGPMSSVRSGVLYQA